MILYGRNPVQRGAAWSPQARGEEVWATAGVAREPWLQGVSGQERLRRGDRAPLRLARPPGHLRRGGRVSVLLRRGAAGRRGPADRGARPGAGPAEPRFDLPHRRVRGRRRRGDPGAPRGRGHAGCLQGIGRRGRAPEGGAGQEHRRLPRGCEQGRDAGAMARAGRRRWPTTSPITAAAAWCSCSAARGTGLRPRVAAACDELIALPIMGAVESLGVSAAASAILYEILQNRGRQALTSLHNCERLAPT